MILVAGASGLLGSEVCKRLRVHGHPVRAFVRQNSRRAPELRDAGAELFVGDLRSTEDLNRACEGVSAVISTATAMGTRDKTLSLAAIDRDAQLATVAAARRAGVAHFVFVSVSPHLKANAPLVRYKRMVEHAVRASGMRWTILQPSVFMEVWLSAALGFDAAAAKATFASPGTGTLGWISVADVAEHCVRSLDDPRMHDRDVPLAGPSFLSHNDVVQEFERTSGRKFAVKRVPRAVLALMSPLVAPFNEMAASGMSLMSQAALGDDFDPALQREIGLPLSSVRDYAARVTQRIQ